MVNRVFQLHSRRRAVVEKALGWLSAVLLRLRRACRGMTSRAIHAMRPCIGVTELAIPVQLLRPHQQTSSRNDKSTMVRGEAEVEEPPRRGRARVLDRWCVGPDALRSTLSAERCRVSSLTTSWPPLFDS